jgi:hypothetical protein
MKKALWVFSGAIVLIYYFSTLYFWSEVWGGIGFFGAIITTPFSMMAAWFFTFFYGWWMWNLTALLAIIIFINNMD